MTQSSYVGAIDQGTSSTRFLVFDTTGAVVAGHQTEFPQIYPQAGWAEHDPNVILKTVHTCIEQTILKMEASGLKKEHIKAVGVTNQRETSVVWDRVTGEPLHNAIVWLDTRTKDLVESLVERTPTKDRTFFQQKCGLPFSTYFSGVKLKWLLENVEQVQDADTEGRLMFGTIDSWLIYKLTGGAQGGVHVTDVSNASRTMLMNLSTLSWDADVLKFFNVKESVLPAIKSSSEVYGTLSEGPLQGVPISGCLGDQQAALVGQGCLQPGQVKNTYGTGCFCLFNTGPKPIFYSKHGLLTTVGYQLGKDAPPAYALEGSVAIAGAAIKWLRDNLNMISESSEVDALAAQVKDTAGVYFVPAFSGLFAPYWRDDARGCIVGLTQFTNKCHIARATLEAVCFQSKEIIDAMNADSGQPLKHLRVDGGFTISDLALQLQADILGIPVERPVMRETTALGAGLAAGLAVGVWPSPQSLPKLAMTTFTPSITDTERGVRVAQWKKAIERSLNWV